jgi:hypothetical protein
MIVSPPHSLPSPFLNSPTPPLSPCSLLGEPTVTVLFVTADRRANSCEGRKVSLPCLKFSELTDVLKLSFLSNLFWIYKLMWHPRWKPQRVSFGLTPSTGPPQIPSLRVCFGICFPVPIASIASIAVYGVRHEEMHAREGGQRVQREDSFALVDSHCQLFVSDSLWKGFGAFANPTFA